MKGMSEKMIIADGLSLTYNSPEGRKVGVGTSPEGLSFSVDKGEIFGVIGPDGAGKTTLFRILCSLLLPQRGKAIVGGFDTDEDYKELRKIIGYMPGNFSLYPDLSIEENLNFFATIFDTSVEENYHLIEDIYSQIEPFKKRKAKSLSGGMKQKLALSCALIHAPEILFLDEPTTGIDPISRVDLWNMLHNLSELGVTIIVSTPYMDEAIQCHRIAFMQEGQFITVDTPQHIISQYPYPLFEVKADDRLSLLNHLRDLPDLLSSFAFGETFHVAMRKGVTTDELKKHLDRLSDNGSYEIRPIKAGLEDAFLLLSSEPNNLV